MASGKAHATSQLLAKKGYFDAESCKIVVELESGAAYRFQLEVSLEGVLWDKVMTTAGQKGYVARQYVRYPVDYRAFFKN